MYKIYIKNFHLQNPSIISFVERDARNSDTYPSSVPGPHGGQRSVSREALGPRMILKNEVAIHLML
jgi:hypothetical protein